jgi:SSS family solute:Na+ symporter
MITGVIASSFGLIFLHRTESASLGICKMLTGKSELISTFPWPYVDTLLYALPLSILALIAVSYCTRPPSRRVIVSCFHYYKR